MTGRSPALLLLTLTVMLAVSGLAKLPQPRATADAMTALRVPLVPPAVGGRLLPWVELALAGLLLLASGPLLVGAATAALGLCAAYLLLVARALTWDHPVDCSCFGKIGESTVTSRTLARNIVLLLVAGLALWGATQGVSVPAALTSFTAADWTWLGATALVVLLTALAVGRPPEYAGRHGGRRRAGRPDPAAPTEPATDQADDLDYVRVPIPFAVVQDAAGGTATLRELAATQARLLVLLSPGCGPCDRVARLVDAWHQRLHPAVDVLCVYAQPLLRVAGRLLHDPAHARHDPEGNVRNAFATHATPSAILLGADGLVAGGPVTGEPDIVELVQLIEEQLAEAATADLAGPPPT